jgi:hypothetical protein
MDGGFDLVVGNPPWFRVEFDAAGVLGEADPTVAIRKMSAPEVMSLRVAVLTRAGALASYFAEYEASVGTQAFLNASQNYPLLRGTAANLFKCFLPVAWRLGSLAGVSAFLHSEGAYDDPNGGALRRAIYQRLTAHYQFVNEKKLFAEPDHHITFSINVYRSVPKNRIEFYTIANLFLPSTVDVCFEHSGSGLVPGIKTEDGDWETRGHRDRLVHVDEQMLAVFAELYDDKGTVPVQARLPAVHSSQIADGFAAMALDLTLEEQKAIWRVQFPIARRYETETFYDSKGRIVFTTSRGLVGVGIPRHDWEQAKNLPIGETVSRTIIDSTQPGGSRERTITYVAPFDRCDREADYDVAWAAFERRRDSASAEAAQ